LRDTPERLFVYRGIYLYERLYGPRCERQELKIGVSPDGDEEVDNGPIRNILLRKRGWKFEEWNLIRVRILVIEDAAEEQMETAVRYKG